MKKKIVSLALAVCLLLVAFVGTTLAYFTDVDNAKNTFEVGGVDILLTEKAYEDGKWELLTTDSEGYVDCGKLEPGVADWYNKCVFVQNLEDDAYIRTFIAVENQDADDDNNIAIQYNATNSTNKDGSTRYGAEAGEFIGQINMGDRDFDIFVYYVLDEHVVESGNNFLSLTTVRLTEDWNNAQSDAYGEVEVYAFAEAIQAAGLSHDEAMKELNGEGSILDHAYALFTGIIPATNK